MTQVSYEIRPVNRDLILERFNDRSRAIAWAKHRNTNPLQSPVRLVKVTTKVTENEVAL